MRDFVALGLHEGEVLDYKRDLTGDVSQTVAAMANTDGGTIIVGVDEDKRTKSPHRADGFKAPEPLGSLSSQIFTYLDPAPAIETNVISAGPDLFFLIVVVAPSTTRAVLHREKGLLVRVGDQCVAPNRSAFERLLAREGASGDEAAKRRDSVAGRAGHWTGPGDGQSRLTVVVAVDPLRPVDIPPSDHLDDVLAGAATSLFRQSFRSCAEPDRSAAELLFHPDHLPNRLSLTRTGQLDVRFCAQPPGWNSPGQPDWLINASLLASDALQCLLAPFAISRAESNANLLPAAAALTFTGWGDKALFFPGLPRLTPGVPFDRKQAGGPLRSGTLTQPSDALALARDAVRDLARFYGQRGADDWARTFPDYVRGVQELAQWRGELLV
ncbi:MAG TPA: ATP-binding protein [Candidatus Limnocylindrales bacterium]